VYVKLPVGCISPRKKKFKSGKILRLTNHGIIKNKLMEPSQERCNSLFVLDVLDVGVRWVLDFGFWILDSSGRGYLRNIGSIFP
jgi:hypothetical protein